MRVANITSVKFARGYLRITSTDWNYGERRVFGGGAIAASRGGRAAKMCLGACLIGPSPGSCCWGWLRVWCLHRAAVVVVRALRLEGQRGVWV